MSGFKTMLRMSVAIPVLVAGLTSAMAQPRDPMEQARQQLMQQQQQAEQRRQAQQQQAVQQRQQQFQMQQQQQQQILQQRQQQQQQAIQQRQQLIDQRQQQQQQAIQQRQQQQQQAIQQRQQLIDQRQQQQQQAIQQRQQQQQQILQQRQQQTGAPALQGQRPQGLQGTPGLQPGMQGQRPALGGPGQPGQRPMVGGPGQGVPGQQPGLQGQRPMMGIPGQQPGLQGQRPMMGTPGQGIPGQQPGLQGQRPMMGTPGQGIPGQQPGLQGQRPMMGTPGQGIPGQQPGLQGQRPMMGTPGQGIPGQQPGFQGRPPMGQPGPGFQQGQGFQGRPPMGPGGPGQQVRRPGGGIGPAGAAAIGFGAGVVGGAILSNQLRGVGEVHQHRETYVDGGVRYVREPGRVIIREEGAPAYIRHDESERFAVLGYRQQVVQENGFTRAFYDRPDGVRIITITDPDGRLVRRIRRYPDGREVVIIDNGFRPRPSRFVDQVVVLPPPMLSIPRERYIVDAGVADEATIYEALTAPPLTKVTRRYTLDEVRYSPDLRAQMRSVDVNTITFDSGSWTVDGSQINRLSTIAAAIGKAIQGNPEEVFLIEGHTDAVGDQDDNLSLSDRRAQSVAEILTRDFAIPAENLTTQGYGETQLRIATEDAARANRRVTVRRITPLIADTAGQGQQ